MVASFYTAFIRVYYTVGTILNFCSLYFNIRYIMTYDECPSWRVKKCSMLYNIYDLRYTRVAPFHMLLC